MALKKKVAKENTVQSEAVVEQEVQTEAVVENEVEAQAETVVEQEVEQETQVETVVEQEVEVKSEPKTQVATQATREVAAAPAKVAGTVGSVAEFKNSAAEAGMEGLEVGGFGSFPILVLGTDGKFEMDDEQLEIESFVGKVESTNPLYLCKQKDVKEGPVAYTYDQVNLNTTVDDATTVAELKAAWAEDGETMEIKKYLEVLVEVIDEDSELFGEFIIVKLPPSSERAFSSQVFLATRKGIAITDIQMNFGIGARRTSGSNKYYPWKFKVVK